MIHSPMYEDHQHASSGETDSKGSIEHISDVQGDQQQAQVYRLYKRRFVGIFGLFFLNIAGGLSWPWFGPIANDMVRDFNISLTRVNWLGNVTNLVYLPVSLLTPVLCHRYGIRVCCLIGAVLMILAAWIRFAGTAKSLSPDGAYAALLVGQILGGTAQPIFQVLGPKYSETWFDLKGRTTATMIIAVSNPIGSALAQLIAPLVGDTRRSILILAIATSAIAPLSLLIGARPPHPPTFSGSQPSPSLLTTLRALSGLHRSNEQCLEPRDRADFGIVVLVFGVLVGSVNAFAILSNQIFGPVGYSSDASGIMGAALLLAGLITAVITSPLFDRVLTHHLALTTKLLTPIVGLGWFAMIWDVRPNNSGGLFAVLIVIGATSLTLLPVALELGCELTRSANTSSAIMWLSTNLFGLIFILVENALRAGSEATPPFNMKRALIFIGVVDMVVSWSVLGLRGKQSRRMLDDEKRREAEVQMAAVG